MRLFLIFVCISILSACELTPTKPDAERQQKPSTSVETEALGIGVDELVEKRESFSPVPISNYYYGQLLVDTTLYKSAVKGPEAQKLMNSVAKTFGSEKTQFGISVTPSLNGVVLPEFVVFSYVYDSDTKSWKTDLTKKYRSPVIPMGDFSKISFKFKYVSSDNKNIQIAEKVSNLISGYAAISPGSWVVSKASSPFIEKAAKDVDGIISGILSNSVEANVDNTLEPVVNGSKGVIYRISTKDEKSEMLADVKFSTRLFTSLVSGRALQNDSVPSNYKLAVPKLEPYTNPLNVIRVNGASENTLGG